MRKFLSKKIRSQGTPLGSLGALSQQDTILGAGQLQILVIWGLYRPPVVVALETHAENLKTAGAWCEVSKKFEFCLTRVFFRTIWQQPDALWCGQRTIGHFGRRFC